MSCAPYTGVNSRAVRRQRPAVLRSAETGITLIEMLIVMVIVGAMMAIAYPNVTSGLEGIRLKTSVDRLGQFWLEARQHADRYQTPVQVSVDPARSEARAVGALDAWRAEFPLYSTLKIAQPKKRATFLIYPGAPSPEFRVLLEGETGGAAGVRINVLTGVPEDWDGK